MFCVEHVLSSGPYFTANLMCFFCFVFSVLAGNGLVGSGGYTLFFCGDLIENLVILTIIVWW